MAMAGALALFFYVSLLYVSSQMIKHRWERYEDDEWKIIVIIVVDVLCISSVVDIFFCPFCKDTRKNYCRNCCGKTQDENVEDPQTYEELMRASPKQKENGLAYSLHRIQNTAEL